MRPWCLTRHSLCLRRAHVHTEHLQAHQRCPSNATCQTSRARSQRFNTARASAADAQQSYDEFEHPQDDIATGAGEQVFQDREENVGLQGGSDDDDVVYASPYQNDDPDDCHPFPRKPSHDPLVHGKRATCDGASFILPDYDYTTDDWMLRVAEDLGWDRYWRFFEELTEDDEEAQVLEKNEREAYYTKSGRLALSAEAKRRQALRADVMMRGKPGYIGEAFEMNEPDFVDEPRRSPVTVLVDEDPWALRAWREKQLMHEELDYAWQCLQCDEWDQEGIVIDHHDDLRIRPKLRGVEKYGWTDDDMWNLITNDGKSVNPYVVRDSATFITQNPLYPRDWVAQDATVEPETEEWLFNEGRLFSEEEEAELDLPSEEKNDEEGEDDEEEVEHVAEGREMWADDDGVGADESRGIETLVE